MNGIYIDKSSLDELRRHALSYAPMETCAVLLGDTKDSVWITRKVLIVPNSAHSPVRFSISDEDLVSVYIYAAQHDLDVVGIFHSHPTSDAVPSETDRKYMRLNPVAWIIYSGINDTCRVWLHNGHIVEIRLILQ